MEQLRSLEKLLGNVKFAVIIILIFAAYLAYGTFQESYHGVDYVNRHVYKSYSFMAVQFLMFLSIFIATLVRLPARKALYGFYTLHAGLLLLFLGSFVTYYAGIDGTLNLPPNTPNRKIVIPKDELIIKKPNEGKELIYPLPYVHNEIDLNEKFENIRLSTYLPFADDVTEWQEPDNAQLNNFAHSSSYFLSNQRMSENLTFSLNEASDFKTSTQLGPLGVHYLPKGLNECFTSKKDFILWDVQTQKCLENPEFDIKKTENAELILVKTKYLQLAFLPNMTPLPIFVTKDNQIRVKESSPHRLFNKKVFEENPNLFLFGRSISYFDSDEEKWVTKDFGDKRTLELPWMGFQVSLTQHEDEKYPVKIPRYTKPIEENQNKLAGGVRALLVIIEDPTGDKEVWVKKDKPIEVTLAGQKYTFDLRNHVIELPYEITLNRFAMDKDPGTNNPASYESFVSLFDNGETSKHHVFMNNPLKYRGMTFYQSSYYQSQQGGPYSSILSVNYDPGRWIKYLGSILLVLGSLWHFVIRKKLIAL